MPYRSRFHGGHARLARRRAADAPRRRETRRPICSKTLVRTGFGTNNVDHCTRLCHASSVAALLECIGSCAVSNPVEDVAKAEVIIVIGSNPTVRNGTKLIAMDPIRTEICRFATYSLQFRPDTDEALLNAMITIESRRGKISAMRGSISACSGEVCSCCSAATKLRPIRSPTRPWTLTAKYRNSSFAPSSLHRAEHCQSGSVN